MSAAGQSDLAAGSGTGAMSTTGGGGGGGGGLKSLFSSLVRRTPKKSAKQDFKERESEINF